ncbi:hypothetical protein COCON_G00058380 [Conger conger]|uniref:Uncharacterized protein n=1 Tax=Conger conger TaxID=82655 RepID=A0A9Q1DR29_CONCO|nr:hypothetical protein COCON_G00058380 [Conger conger]
MSGANQPWLTPAVISGLTRALICPLGRPAVADERGHKTRRKGAEPPAGQENLVQRDFVASLEAEAYDDQVGETVGKKDYIPCWTTTIRRRTMQCQCWEMESRSPMGHKTRWIRELQT